MLKASFFKTTLCLIRKGFFQNDNLVAFLTLRSLIFLMTFRNVVFQPR